MPRDGLKRIKYKLNVGDIKGKYKLLELIKIENKNGSFKRKWLCENIYTKEQKLLSNDYLGNYVEKHTKEIDINNVQIGVRHKLYDEYKRNAKKRNIDFNLTFEEFDDITNKKCHYCNSEPKEISLKHIKRYGNSSQPNITKNGIDRLDNELGYNIDNCVPCCEKCNKIKRDMSLEDFIEQVNKIYNFKKLNEYD